MIRIVEKEKVNETDLGKRLDFVYTIKNSLSKRASLYSSSRFCYIKQAKLSRPNGSGVIFLEDLGFALGIDSTRMTNIFRSENRGIIKYSFNLGPRAFELEIV